MNIETKPSPPITGGDFIPTIQDVLQELLNDLNPLDFRNKAGLTENEKIQKSYYVILSVEEIVDVAMKKNYSLCINEGNVFVFNKVYWKAINQEDFKDFLGKAGKKLGVPTFTAKHYSFKNELWKQFISSSYLQKPQRTDELLINLKNGTFVINDEKTYLRPFHHEDFLTYQLPFDYDPSKVSPVFFEYLNKVLPDEDQQKVLAEFIAYLFVSSKRLKLEKSLILYGDGANGKSVFFEIVFALLGKENVSNYSLQSLTDADGYYRAMLSNKLLNYASEISPKMDSTIFKQMASGEPIEARLPYGEPFILMDYAKLMFNTNELPKDVEQNEAFFRRFLIIHFNKTIPEKDRDPNLSKRIVSNELPGIFNWVLEGLERLIENNGFSYSESIIKTLNEYKKQSDSVRLFLEDEGYVESTTVEIALKGLYLNYHDHCKSFGYKACSLKEFSKRLRNAGYEIVRKNIGNVINAVKKDYKIGPLGSLIIPQQSAA